MLTDSERAWLEERDNWFSPWCSRCDGRFHCDEHKLYGKCSLTPDTDDAAEFEARVAAKLAERCVLLEKVVQKNLGVAEYINLSAAAENTLKAARLQVEEEMDAN